MGILDRARRSVGAGLLVAALCVGAHAQDLALEPAAETSTEAVVERRFAMLVGQVDYPGAPIKTGTNDASYIQSALEGLGFQADGVTDLDQVSIRERLRDLATKVMIADGADTIFVYLSGRVAQLDGENYLLPVGTSARNEAEVVLNGLRLRDVVDMLRGMSARARILVIDAAAPPEQLKSDLKFSPGLAKMDAPDGFLIAFNQSPGRDLLEPKPPLGVFAQSILDAIQRPAPSFAEFFAFARTRVFEETKNEQSPWTSDRLPDLGYAFFPPEPGQSLPTLAQRPGQKVELASLSREDAFRKVIATDSIEGYQAFLVRFPEDEAAATVQYNLAVRREAEVWSGALGRNQPDGYWTYLTLYPDGGNVSVARQRLVRLGAPLNPPPGFAPISFAGLPPPVAGVEVIASSASMPAQFIPKAPSLNLPTWSPVAVAAVAAASAATIAAAAAPVGFSGGRGRALPRVSLQVARPSWAAPAGVRPMQGQGQGYYGLPRGGVAAPAPRVAPAAAFQPLSRPTSAGAPSAMGAGPGGVRSGPSAGGPQFQPLARSGPTAGQPGPVGAPGRIVGPQGGGAPGVRPVQMPAQPAPAMAGRGGMPGQRMAPQMAPRAAAPRTAAPRMAAPRMAAPRMAAPRVAAPRMSAPRSVKRR